MKSYIFRFLHIRSFTYLELCIFGLLHIWTTTYLKFYICGVSIELQNSLQSWSRFGFNVIVAVSTAGLHTECCRRVAYTGQALEEGSDREKESRES